MIKKEFRIEIFEACQCIKCAEGFYIISDPITLIEICIPCEVHGCISCNADGRGCSICEEGYELIDEKCIGDQTPATPTITNAPSSSSSTPSTSNPSSSSSSTSIPSASSSSSSIETEQTSNYSSGEDDGNSGNSSKKSNKKKIGLIAGVAVLYVLIIASIIVLVIIVIIRRRSSAPIAIRTEDVYGEMQQEPFFRWSNI